MNTSEIKSLTRFIRTYLALTDGEVWREGKFVIRYGKSQKKSEPFSGAIKWAKSNPGQPRPEQEVLDEIVRKVGELTEEAHERIWVVAKFHGERHNDEWLPLLKANKQRSDRAGAIELPDPSEPGGAAALAITANTQMAMGALDRNNDLTTQFLDMAKNFYKACAERDAAMMLLSVKREDHQSEQYFAALESLMEHAGPAFGKGLGILVDAVGDSFNDGNNAAPADTSSAALTPTQRAEKHICGLETSAAGIKELHTESPEAFTSGQQIRLLTLYKTIQGWFGETPEAKPETVDAEVVS